jgi:hypothetical protein
MKTLIESMNDMTTEAEKPMSPQGKAWSEQSIKQLITVKYIPTLQRRYAYGRISECTSNTELQSALESLNHLTYDNKEIGFLNQPDPQGIFRNDLGLMIRNRIAELVVEKAKETEK